MFCGGGDALPPWVGKMVFNIRPPMQKCGNGGDLSKVSVSAMIMHEMWNGACGFPQGRFPHSLHLWKKPLWITDQSKFCIIYMNGRLNVP